MSQQPNGLETLESESAVAPQIFDFNFRALDNGRFRNSGPSLPAATSTGVIFAGEEYWTKSDGANRNRILYPAVIFLDATSSSVVETLGDFGSFPLPAGTIVRFARSDEAPGNTVTIEADAPDTLDGVSGGSFTLARDEGATVVYAGSGAWYRLA